MSTFREIVYLILDELKLSSDDSYYTEDHIIYMINNYRAFLLKQRYSDIKKSVPDANYQELCITLQPVENLDSSPCEKDSTYMKSTTKIPTLMNTSNTRVYSKLYYTKEIPFVSKDRLKYVGYNRFIPMSVYASRASDSYLYLKGFSDKVLDITNVKLYGMFYDAVEASESYCVKACNILDREFPLEEALIPPLVELVVKELLRATYSPEDPVNNAADDLSKVNTK